MQIILVHSTKDGIIHGTDNLKKTGCGINITKVDKYSSYVKGAEMTDLKEITCEKCKMVLAKRIIKETQKELKDELKKNSKLDDDFQDNVSSSGKLKFFGKKKTEQDVPSTDEKALNTTVPSASNGKLPSDVNVTPVQPKHETVSDSVPAQNIHNETENDFSVKAHFTYSKPEEQETIDNIPDNSATETIETINVSQNNSAAVSPIAAKDSILSQFAIPKTTDTVNSTVQHKKPSFKLDGDLAQFAIEKPAGNIPDEQPVQKKPALSDIISQMQEIEDEFDSVPSPDTSAVNSDFETKLVVDDSKNVIQEIENLPDKQNVSFQSIDEIATEQTNALNSISSDSESENQISLENIELNKDEIKAELTENNPVVSTPVEQSDDMLDLIPEIKIENDVPEIIETDDKTDAAQPVNTQTKFSSINDIISDINEPLNEAEDSEPDDIYEPDGIDTTLDESAIDEIFIPPVSENKQPVENPAEINAQTGFMTQMDELLPSDDEQSVEADDSPEVIYAEDEKIADIQDLSASNMQEINIQPQNKEEVNPVQTEQPDAEPVVTDNTKILYNELGQRLYPVYTDKGQLFYTTEPPAQALTDIPVVNNSVSSVRDVQEIPQETEIQKGEIQEEPQTPSHGQGINPQVAAMIYKKQKPQIEEHKVFTPTAPVVDSIEDALNQLGVDVENQKKKDDNMPVFMEYKPPEKKKSTLSPPAQPIQNEKSSQNTPLSRAELKLKKKLEKIDAEFEKKLRERGFDPDEDKRKRKSGKL